MKEKYDVVIVGGGITGALLAYKLSKNTNLSILILEAGDDRSSERVEMSLSYAAASNKTPGSPYKNAPAGKNIPFPDVTKPGIDPKTNTYFSDYYRYSDDKTNFKSTYLKIGGGSTWHWLGNVPRLLPNDFKLQEVYQKGVNWPISYDDLEKYYGEAEHEIGVSGNHEQWNNLHGAYRSDIYPMPEIWPTYSDKIVKEKLQGTIQVDNRDYNIDVRSTPQARNSQEFQGRPACAGNSSCVPICPIQAKYDATVHLSKAKENGVEISYQSIVFKIEQDVNKKINFLYYRNWAKEEKKVSASVFVLAIHSIESALLLQVSDIANSSGAVGKYLMDHPQGYGMCITADPVFPFRGPPTTSGIDVFRDGAFRKESSAFRISLGNDGWGRGKYKGKDNLDGMMDEFLGGPEGLLIGDKLRKAVEQMGTRLFRFSYSTEMLPIATNTVKPDTEIDAFTGLPKPLINFKIDDENEYNKKGFLFAGKVMRTLLGKLANDKTSVDVIDDVAGFSGAGHIMGTTRMGNDPASSVVNKHCQSHDHANLFIVGPGVFPTCGTANPTLTVAALSLRLANKIIHEFDSLSL